MEVKYTDTKPTEPRRKHFTSVMLGKRCVSECDDDAICITLLYLLGSTDSGKSCLARRFTKGPIDPLDRTFGGMRIEWIALVIMIM